MRLELGSGLELSLGQRGKHSFLLLTQSAHGVLDLRAADRSPSLPRNVSAPTEGARPRQPIGSGPALETAPVNPPSFQLTWVAG